MNENQLQAKVQDLIEKFYQKEYKYSYSEAEFNVFKIFGIQNKEIYHCKFLQEVLNPDGKHSQGDLFLKKFYKIVLERPYHKKTEIQREAELDKKSRVDLLLIEKYDHYEIKIPIEVKIYAGEGKRQLQRYTELCNNDVYFLTMSKRKPVSIDDVSKVHAITFDDHIKKWLASCIEDCSNSNVKNLFIQYKQIVDELVGEKEIYIFEQLKNEQSSIEQYVKNTKIECPNEIQKLILNTNEHFKKEESLPFLQLKKEIFQTVTNHIQTKYEYEPIDIDSYPSLVDYCYLHPSSKKFYASIVFKYKENDKGNQCLAISLDIAKYVCVGLKFYKKENDEWISENIDEIRIDEKLIQLEKKFKRKCSIRKPEQYPEYFFWERIQYKNKDIDFSKYDPSLLKNKEEILTAILKYIDDFLSEK